MAILIAGRSIGMILLLSELVLLWYFNKRMKAGKMENIRALPALAAIEECVGRSVELGKPVLSTTGYMGDVGPVGMVGLQSVSYVSKIAAEKGCEMVIAIASANQLPIAIENYRMGCIEGGRPESFNLDNVYYVTVEQRAYISGIFGVINERKPAGFVGIGGFWVDAIHIGVQLKRRGVYSIGGTEKYDSGAFFFITMDYTVFGSEMYALGAAMSKDPIATSGVITEDILKYVLSILAVVGSILMAAKINIILTIFGL